MPLSDLILACGTDIVEVGFEGGAEFRQVQAAVDAAELVIDFEHPSGAPAQRHRAVPPALDVLGVLPQISIMDSMGLVERRVLARVGGTPSRRMVSGPVRRLKP